MNFWDLDQVEKKNKKLQKEFIEMGQLKSDFDIEKFTCQRHGHFIAHNFHFLMRQYHLNIHSLRKKLIKKEELKRKIKEILLVVKGNPGIDHKIKIEDAQGNKREVYLDLHLRTLLNQAEQLEVNLINKVKSLEGFEKCRLKLIELNGGNLPTNDQHQKEEPAFWKWFFQNKMLHQQKQRASGISEGIWMNLDYCMENPILTEDYQFSFQDKALKLPG